MEISKKKIEEIKISVPWGHLAGKAWGEETDPLVVCTHGIMDNAGSHDRLIPYLPNSFYYVAIDIPGHGQSSHFPPHLPIHTLNYLLVYKYISSHFGKKYIIMGHSYGGQIGFLYAQLYPDCVERLILLDTIVLYPVFTKNFKDFVSGKIDDFVKINKKLSERQAPSYTKEEALNRLRNGRHHGAIITLEAAEALLTRSIKEVENGRYRFTLDQRIKHSINPTHDFRCIIETLALNPVRCPILIILGKECSSQQVYFSSVIRYLKKWKNVSLKIVDGNHDVHNIHPERVAPLIVKFLLFQKGSVVASDHYMLRNKVLLNALRVDANNLFRMEQPIALY